MAKVIQFPVKQDPCEKMIEYVQNSINEYENDERQQLFKKAANNLQKRFGVTWEEYLGFKGDPEEVNTKIERSLQKERLQILTKYMNDWQYDHYDR